MYFEQIQAAAAAIRQRLTQQPVAGIILGSGLGDLAHMMDADLVIPYAEIPGFPRSTVKGHAGQLLFGLLQGRYVMMMSGRFHYYEGYSMQEVTFPVRVMKALGIDTLLVSNAAGGMRDGFRVGDIMFLKDHINLFPEHPLRGPNDERLGTRFPDMSEPYHMGMLAKAKQIAQKLEIPVHEGVYAGLQGPTFETRAEYNWLHVIGADAVGMSTVPEVIVAIHGGMKVFAASIITDLGIREELNIITHEEVLQAAAGAAPKLASIMAGLVKSLG